MLEEYTPDGIIVVSYVHGKDLISQTRGGQTSFYHVDGLGSTRILTDVFGTVTDRYIYDAFGWTVASLGSTVNVHLFAGERRDADLGWDYLRARNYGPSVGRFASRDPFPGFVFEVVSLHKYLYANADPVNFTDPTGKFTLGERLVILATVASMVTINIAPSAVKGKASAWLSNVALSGAERATLTANPQANTEAAVISRLFHEWYDKEGRTFQSLSTCGAFSLREGNCVVHAQQLATHIRSSGTTFREFRFRVYEDVACRHTFLVAKLRGEDIFLNLDSWLHDDRALSVPFSPGADVRDVTGNFSSYLP